MKELKTKDKVLNLLKEYGNTYVSGEDIANRLFLTRAGVWKAIKALRESGYSIEAVNNRGYCLVTDDEPLSESKINEFLANPIKVITLDEVDSTNNEIRKYALNEFEDSMLLVSDYQTSGRGRRGREFYSPKGTGLYMSLLLHPDTEIAKATKITSIAAVSVCRAISKVAGIETEIKWVNDIFFNGLKIAGILTEAFTSVEDGSLSYVIVGIGINLYPPHDGFPANIKKIAGTLFATSTEASDIKNRLCAEIINEFTEIYNSDSDDYISEYRSRSCLIGNYVKIIQPGKNLQDKGYALVTGIDNDCHLLVKYDDGTSDSLSTGEVSVVKY